MGNGMNKVLPGLYVGNYRDSKDQQQLDKFQITHIVAIHDSPRRLLPDKHYLCVMAADTPDQNLSQYFSVCNDFIHAARLREGNVLIHCLAGMSRSVTVAVAYIMSATTLNWKEALKVVRAGRAVANPNVGFQTQLQEFEMFRLADERRRLKERFPSTALEQSDRTKCVMALDNYQELLQNKDICEGNCSRGEKCPTGSRNSRTTNQTAGCGAPCNSGQQHACKSSTGGVSYALYFIIENWRTLRIDSKEKDKDKRHPGKPMMENVVYYCPIDQANAEEYHDDNEPSTSSSCPKPSLSGSNKNLLGVSGGLSEKTRSSIDRLSHSPDATASRRNTSASLHSVASQASVQRRGTTASIISQQSQSSRRNTTASMHSVQSQSSRRNASSGTSGSSDSSDKRSDAQASVHSIKERASTTINQNESARRANSKIRLQEKPEEK